MPKDAPKESIHSSGELRAYSGIPAKGPVSDETARNLIHGYYACVSYTDGKGKFLARMLYDHSNDPGENVNVAENEILPTAASSATETP